MLDRAAPGSDPAGRDGYRGVNGAAGDPPLVSILVVTYKQHRLLARCLDSVATATRGLATETILVVNGVLLQPEHRAAASNGATLLHAPVNLGLPGGLQWARSHARGRYLAVLQDDVEVDERWLGPLLEILERDPSVGAVGSRVSQADGTPWGDGMIVARSGWGRILEPAPRPDADWAVDVCFSASCVVRTEAWDSVGGPNARLFPNQYVDIDLGLRLATADWSVLVSRDSVVRHVRNASTTEPQRTYLLVRNHRILVRDHRTTLAGRPPSFGSSDDFDEWLRHLSAVATRRRTTPPVHRIVRGPIPFATLVRDARIDARRVRLGQALFPLRVGLYRLRHAALRTLRRARPRS
jgi:GT2 family glycosyltransferase